MNATLVSNDGWFPASWRGRPARQMPEYADEAAVRAVEARLATAAPVVQSEDSAKLRDAVAGLAMGSGFLLQGGDCAESFDDPVAEQVAGIVGLFDAMAGQLHPAVNGALIEIARTGVMGGVRPAPEVVGRKGQDAEHASGPVVGEPMAKERAVPAIVLDHEHPHEKPGGRNGKD